MCISRRQRGLTLVELIVFIVIVSVALAGVLTVFSVTVKSSADPMIRKQMLAIAEAVLEEVMLQPFTWCDPDDRSAATATSATLDGTATDPTKCWDAIEGIGKETVSGITESRGSATSPLDNVSDYDSEAISTNIAGGGAAQYTANVTVAAADLNTITAASGAALLITVSVAVGNETIQLQGYRTRHSPNVLP
ncbi:MAG: type II secretion system GspH family protein [Sulfuritalea sp.]|jgi:MSHA pilin protein MshD|nr:type II secretion system GspH family protein [Sulfuritalea sp.]